MPLKHNTKYFKKYVLLGLGHLFISVLLSKNVGGRPKMPLHALFQIWVGTILGL
jgi:hypothetical protein